MKINKDFVLNLIGVVLIIFFIIRFIFLVLEGMYSDVFWLCNHTMLIMGIAVLMRNSFWLTAEISFAFVGVVIWIIDYFSKLIFDIYIFGSNTYLFPIVNQTFFYLTSMVHLLTLPLALWAWYLIRKKEPSAWKGAMLHGIILIPVSIYFGEQYNLNCLLESCVSWIPTFVFYPLVFVILYSVVFVIPVNKGLDKLLK